MGLFNKIKNAFSKDKEAVKYDDGLSKTRREFATELSNLSRKYKNIDEDYFEELENILIMADIGVNTVMEFTKKIKERVKRENCIFSRQRDLRFLPSIFLLLVLIL